MSELEEYREWSLAFVPEPPPDVSDYKLGYRRGVITSAEYADAAIAELEAERDKWADSFKQAEAALEGFLGPDGLSPYERERDTALAERDKWEWVARDACRELAYETHVNPQSPLDYRLAHWRTREGGER